MRKTGKKQPRSGLSKALILAGIVLLIAAAVVAILFLREDREAGESAAADLPAIEAAIEGNRTVTGAGEAQKLEGDESASPENDGTAGKPEDDRPLYKRFPQMDMPVITIDGRDYVGILRVPSQGIELPVMSEFTYPNLQKSPCRYSGSAYLGNLVLCGHNYASHFQRIRYCNPGDSVEFTDADGNVFRYQVVQIETLGAFEHQRMVDSEYALTLFTCTFDSRSRVTVRCIEEDSDAVVIE